MTPIMTSIILLLSLISIYPTVSKGSDENENLDVNEIIARVNANITTHLIHGDIALNVQRNADPCTDTGCKWPKYGKYVYIPISISSSYSRTERSTIIRGLLSFYKDTCIRFRWRRWWHRNYLYFFPGSGCWSYLGRQPRGQAISLQKNGCVYLGTVQHEVLHALGFHHEQVRSDRDDHVTINFDNIKDGAERNFQKVDTNNLSTPYDFDSVMHYSNMAFSKNGEPTIVAINNPDEVIGGAQEMSGNDTARVNELYQCDV
ncbi:low choriolytic enzyme-like [Dunckerocampus dactyliophorus]|uniref:low choriolytic enzyme-like n=1 Tax=Dunckerocampus dactyliophorus TaxID=161453 RepID=UPI002405FC4A|nr:low choriolytic enzyme-like [Dunckerocampus dactyliophorus]